MHNYAYEDDVDFGRRVGGTRSGIERHKRKNRFGACRIACVDCPGSGQAVGGFGRLGAEFETDPAAASGYCEVIFLVDSSVWIQHFRNSLPALRDLLSEGLVLTHPFVIGEIACGSLKNRKRVLENLSELPAAVPATNEEVMRLLDDKGLWGKGLGWIDLHLLASSLLSGCQLWTLDAALGAAAASLKVLTRGA
jgi:predicted nucleic acid-binding protein